MKKILLIDVGNTTTDFALAAPAGVGRVVSVPTAKLTGIPKSLGKYSAAVLASVVPAVTRQLRGPMAAPRIVVSAETDLGIGIRYPNKHQIGADRLANAVGVVNLYGAPAIVVDFGTAVTFDVVNSSREYVGGVIAPGISAMTHYLHEHTALLPNITPHEPRSVIGKSTVAAMQVGTVVGYRGLVKEILAALRREPGLKKAVVVATGGYGDLIARKVPEIQHVNPLLTLEGLRFIYLRTVNGDR
jgi:type III pantothenate kinase